MTSISIKFKHTLTNNNFQNIISGISYSTISGFLEEGNFKVVDLLFGIEKTSLTVADQLFAHKLMAFLYELRNTSHNSRKKQIEKVDNDSDYKIDLGDKLLFILDKCEDYEKATFIGKLFQCFIAEKIGYDEFIRGARSINLVCIDDLKRFIEERWMKMDLEDGADLLGAGLMDAVYSLDIDTGMNVLKLETSYIGKKIQDLLAECTGA